VILPGRPGPLFPDEAGFVEASIGGLPLPVDLLELLAVVDQERPQFIEEAFLVPAVHRPMHRGIAAEFLGQLVPLAARPGAVDHAVEASPLVGAGSPPARRRVEFSQKRQEQVVPDLVGDFPDRGQCLARFVLAHAPLSQRYDFWDRF
jgi:hypothetical protein